MKFNLDDYKSNNYCMHCKTLAEAVDFCQILDKNNRSWMVGNNYVENNYWDNYQNKTVYYFNKGTYGNIDKAQEKRCIILEWSDFTKDTDEQCVICNSEIDESASFLISAIVIFAI